MERGIDWQLHIGFHRPATCFHGGTFFEAIGPRFDALHRRHEVINADVLDAWFAPSPRVTEALGEHLPWLVRTSPPNHAEGLTAVIAEARGVGAENVLAGAGSSSLIFLALRQWLTPSSRALVLDPMYAEYAHVLEKVIGCRVDRLALDQDEQYRVSPAVLAEALKREYDLVVLVNPNSPTGQHVPLEVLEGVLRNAPVRTRVWVDETYVDYVGVGESLERFAASSENVIVCKSMSKVYALSGVRAAYLCAGEHQIEGLRPISPPWAVSLPAQVAAIEALGDRDYYEARWRETDRLRQQLEDELGTLGWRVVQGCANFVLTQLPGGGPTAGEVVARCREHGVFVRDAANMGAGFGDRAIRVAVKDGSTQGRLVEVLRRVVGMEGRCGGERLAAVGVQ
jgi:histidinol-phosphate/aromatic aminotransferase/cobyric acid decarboxylase-like protein